MSDNKLLATLIFSIAGTLIVLIIAVASYRVIVANHQVITTQTALQNGYSQTTLPGTIGWYWTK